MTDLMAEVLSKVIEANNAGRWYRAARAGERVTLAYLVDHRRLMRRPWRGDGVSRDSAFEYATPSSVRRHIVPTNGKERNSRV